MVDTCTLTGFVRTASWVAVPNAVVTFEPNPRSIVGRSGSVLLPEVQRTTLNSSGAISYPIVPGEYTASMMTSTGLVSCPVSVPDLATAVFADCLQQSPPVTPSVLLDARAARDLSQAWAESPTAPGGVGTQSSLTSALQAKADADRAAQYAVAVISSDGRRASLSIPTPNIVSQTTRRVTINVPSVPTVVQVAPASALPELRTAAIGLTNLPQATGESLMRSADLYDLMRREGDDLTLGTARFTVGDKSTPFQLVTADKYRVMSLDRHGSFSILGTVLSVDKTVPFSLRTADGYELIGLDPASGTLRMVEGPARRTVPASPATLPGVPAGGVVTNSHRLGVWFGYQAHGGAFSGAVTGHNVFGDWTSPHVAATGTFEVWRGDGQSWATMNDYTPDEVDLEEKTGLTGAAIRAAATPLVSILRRDASTDGAFARGDYTGILDTISNAVLPGELARCLPGERYSISRMAAICLQRGRLAQGLPTPNIVVLQIGWPGTGTTFFMPPGTSYNYTDDLGVARTASAALKVEAGDYLWTRQLDRIAALKAVIAAKWAGWSLSWGYYSWIQGPPDDYGEAFGFYGLYRAQQNALDIGPPHILWDQNAARTSQVLQALGLQAIVDFCRTNASGKDWLVGPRYPHKHRDDIHHSSFGALEYAERKAQAALYIELYGSWEPLWITGVAFAGANVTLTINTPRQCSGPLVVNNTLITPQTNHGFTLRNATTDTAIAITGIVVGTNTVTLQTAATLSGRIEVGYAARGVAQTLGTVAAPQHAGCWGNITRVGRDAPRVIPASIRPTLDHWLCTHRKIYTV